MGHQDATDREGPTSPWPDMGARAVERLGLTGEFISMGSDSAKMETRSSYTDEETWAATLTNLLTDIFGHNIWDDGALMTSKRVLRYWQEMAQHLNPKGGSDKPGEVQLPFGFTTFEAEKGQMICVPNIEFASLCAHHLMPFSGVVHMAYVSNEVQVGLSKIPRLVDYWAQRPQVQERLTWQIASDLKARLKPHGVMVVIEASHTCMSCRGVRKHNGAMVTSLPVGVFLSNPSARDEFYAHVSAFRRGV